MGSASSWLTSFFLYVPSTRTFSLPVLKPAALTITCDKLWQRNKEQIEEKARDMGIIEGLSIIIVSAFVAIWVNDNLPVGEYLKD